MSISGFVSGVDGLVSGDSSAGWTENTSIISGRPKTGVRYLAFLSTPGMSWRRRSQRPTAAPDNVPQVSAIDIGSRIE